MSPHDIQVLTLVRQIESAASSCETAVADTHEDAKWAAWSDPAALRQIRLLAIRARELLSAEPVNPVVAMSSEAPQSSVEIESMAKGTPKVKVKVYDATPGVAAARAMDLYGEIVTSYVQAAKVTEKEAVNV